MIAKKSTIMAERGDDFASGYDAGVEFGCRFTRKRDEAVLNEQMLNVRLGGDAKRADQMWHSIQRLEPIEKIIEAAKADGAPK